MKVVRSQDCSLKLKVTETFQETSFMDDGFSTVRFQGVHCSAEGRLWSQGQESWYESWELDEFYWRFRVFQGWNVFFNFWTKSVSPSFRNRLGKCVCQRRPMWSFSKLLHQLELLNRSFMIPLKRCTIDKERLNLSPLFLTITPFLTFFLAH